MERILLKTIKFDLQVDHPYRFLIEYAKCLKSTGGPPKEVVQKAWNFINDSLETTLCLQWEPEVIAVAMMYLACKISKYDVTDWKGRTSEHQKWWDMFVRDMTKNILEDICHQVSCWLGFSVVSLTILSLFQVLDLYQNPKNKTEVPDSPPQLPPSKASPPMKRARLQQSPIAPSKSATNHIPVKVSSLSTLVQLLRNLTKPPTGVKRRSRHVKSASNQQHPPPVRLSLDELQSGAVPRSCTASPCASRHSPPQTSASNVPDAKQYEPHATSSTSDPHASICTAQRTRLLSATQPLPAQEPIDEPLSSAVSSIDTSDFCFWDTRVIRGSQIALGCRTSDVFLC
jgi:hypothetical protein